MSAYLPVCLPALQSAGSLKGAAEVHVVQRVHDGAMASPVLPIVLEVPVAAEEGCPRGHVEVPAPNN